MDIKILNMARAYLSLSRDIRAGFRKVRKKFFKEKDFQNALTQAGSEVRLERHRINCLQGYASKKAKVDGKVGNHKYVHETSEEV